MRLTSKHFSAFFIFELKRFSRNRVMIIAGFLVWLLSLVFVQIGAGNYRSILAHKDEFQAVEQMKVSQYTTYTQYGGYGYRILFLPPPVSAFFINSGVIPDVNIISYVDSGERLKIYQPLIGPGTFKPKKFGFTDFSGIILFFGSLLSILYGFDTFQNREFIKMVSSAASHRYTYRYLQLSRLLILVMLLLFIITSGMLLAAVNGIYFSFNRYLVFFILLILFIAVFFFKLGSVFSSLKSKKIGIFLVLSCWFILVYPLPSAVDYYISLRAKLMTTLNKLEMEKLKIVMGFEKRAIKEAGTFDYGKEVTKKREEVILSYYNNEFRKIHSLEEDMRRQMKACVRQHQLLSILFPTTLYLSGTAEISGMGYGSLIDNYRYVQESKKGFFKYYMDKLYFSGEGANVTKVEPYIKGDGNIYRAGSALPAFFLGGALLNLLVLILLSRFSYFMFKRRIFAVEEAEVRHIHEDSLEHRFEKGQFKVMDSEFDIFINLMFNLLSGDKTNYGKMKLPFKIFINGQDIFSAAVKEPFIYICHPKKLPGDTSAGDLIVFLSHFAGKNGKAGASGRVLEPLRDMASTPLRKLSKEQKGRIILALMKIMKRDIYLVDNAARSMSIEFTVHLKQRMDNLKDSGALVILVTDEAVFTAKMKTGKSVINENSDWCMLVDHCKELYNIQPLEDELECGKRP
jgi:ABC-type transport system involved in cytochrome c biogenesis ATPase subunit